MNRKAVILAGGLGKRMGTCNKGDLLYTFQSFLNRIIDQLSNFDEIILSLNKNQSSNIRDIKVVYDSIDEIGPMGGMLRGFREIKKTCDDSQWVLLLACDSPNITAEFIDYLYEFISSDYEAIITKGIDGQEHPLLGLYKLSVLKDMERLAVEKNYKVFNLLKKLSVKYVDLKFTKFSDEILKNINTIQDYKELLEDKIPVIAVSGIKNSGKTTLITKLIKKFNEKNIRVGTLKHDGHDFNMDNLDSDTDKHIKAGAAKTLIFSKTKFMYLEKNKESETEKIETEKLEIEKYLKYYDNCDLVILEGFKKTTYPKIEIVRKATSNKRVANKENLMFYASDVDEILADESLDSIELDNLDEIFNRIYNYMKEKRCLI